MATVNKSAKRQLYKPAANGSISRGPKAKGLAQGILSDSNTSWQEELSRSASDFHAEEGVHVISTSHEKRGHVIAKDRTLDQKRERSPPKPKLREIENFNESGVVDDLPTRPHSYRNEVILVDATGPAFNPDSSEVTTTVHKIFSPVKVICHSPSPDRQKQSYDQIDNISGAYDVKVDSPKQIVFESKHSLQNDTNDNTDTEQESTERFSAIDTKEQETKLKRKKKPPRVIKSRYLNPKETSKKPEDDVSKSKPTSHSFIHDISAIQSHGISDGTIKGHGTKKKKAKVTSTPFNPQAWSEKTRMIADGSYLDISKNIPAGHSDVKHEVLKTSKDSKETHSTNAGHGRQVGGDSGISSGIMLEHQEPVSEKQLMLKYCRMLQATFLNAKAKETFAKQEKEAKQQIYNVWQENQRLKAEIRQLEQACVAKRHAITLDQLLKVQDAGLRPIDESLAKLHNNYLTMGEALDSTRHYMPIENIVIGDEDKLISTLKETQMILAEISSYTGTKEAGIEKLATNLSHIVETFNAEIAEQNRCQELLIAANSKTNHERSLQSQLLQSRKE